MLHTPPTPRAPSGHGRFRLARVAVACVLATACVACSGRSGTSSGTSSGGADAGGRLVWGKPAEVDVLDPTVSTTATAWELLNLSYENLVGLDDHLKPVPALATSWRQSSPTTYVFELRKGVRFSNGREMTADDVVGSLRRLDDPKLKAWWSAQLDLRDVAKSGPTQVTVTLAKPRTSFIAALAGTPAAILPIKELKAGTFDPKKELLGTGPFKVVAHSQSESWTFARNPFYRDKSTPKVSTLTVRIMPDDAARAAALRDGSVDVTTFETPDSIRLLKGQANVKTTVQSTTDYYTMYVNAKRSILSDDRLRQALALSIDRDKLVKVALGGVGRATAAAPVAFNVCDPAAMPFATPDPARARQLVEAAGATGKTVDIITIPAVPMAAPMAQVLQQSLQSAGLKVHITSLEIGQALKRERAGDFDLFIGWFAGYSDPAMNMPTWNPKLAGFNEAWARSDAQLNTLIDESVSTEPGAARAKTLRDTCMRIASNANIIPLVTKDAIAAYRTDKVNAVVSPLEGYAVPLRHLAEFSARRP